MELKSNPSQVPSAFASSQSYLYGIEMVKKGDIDQTSASLNRTFMELKWLTKYGPHLTLTSSQSYLYGIEITEGEHTIRRILTVSQSYLYGIEMLLQRIELGCVKFVSIVPLWN